MIGITRGYTTTLYLQGVGYSSKLLDPQNIKENNQNKNKSTCLSLFQNYKFAVSPKIENVKQVLRDKTNKLTEKHILLNLGFSHNILFTILVSDINIQLLTIDQKPSISIFGISKFQVNQIAANIYQCKKPEPYKGKGIRYENDNFILKPGKRT